METFINLNLVFANNIWLILLPIILMVLDILTGYYNAWKSKTVSSSKMRDGIGKKIAELCYIFIGILFSFAFNLPTIAYFISIYIIYMETVSIAENCKKLGVPMPDKIQKVLNNKNDKK